MEIDFTPLKAAKLTQGEFASVLKVSRVTVCNWMRGTVGIHDMRKPQVARLLRAIEKATLEGDLPVPRGTSRVERLSNVKKVLVKHLRMST